MAQEPAVEVATEAPKNSKKKLIIILAAVLLLAGGGGGAAWYFMHQGNSHGKDAKKEAEKEEAVHVEPAFVKLETFTVNLNPEDGEKYLQVDITLSASSKEEAASLEEHMPLVRNRVLMVLTSKMASEISSMDGKKALSKEIAAQINQPFAVGAKPQKVSDVFFTSFVIQ
jgi:flagellar FliL protein